MPHIKLKPNYKVVQTYYDDIHRKKQLSYLHEGSVAPHFARLLEYCSKQLKWTLVEQYSIKRKGRSPLRADGALLDKFNLVRGVWEAKDEDNDLEKEVRDKFNVGYPKDNILFQSPQRAILYQGGELVLEADISEPTRLVDLLKLFFAYELPAIEEWEQAVEEFKDKVPQLARSVLDLIREERRHNQRFVTAFEEFSELVKQAINPNISVKALEEMLIQHLLTERLLRTVFNNPDFTNRNIVAVEIEKVIQALTSRHFSRHEFLKQLDRFYVAIEGAAATITDFSQKQDFLNTVYENFFQGFSVKLADTHGIVYTPQPIVNFMVQSVADILQQEFNLSLDSPGVHILDPFVGTGNFILRLMRHLPKTRLPHKYAHELHCNEVMLLPYYIASMSIEHDYFELTGQYQPFNGICLVDTFELAEPQQHRFFVPQNTQRVEHQQNTPIFVILGNPPYNIGQVNENDNNQNRTYDTMDQQVAATYAADSTATNRNALSDPYVKAFRWAANRITKHGEDGIVAFVTNNGFLNGIAFDGMRKHLEQDFSKIYHIDLKGNARTAGERRQKEAGNIFNDTIRVGVGITFLIRQKKAADTPAEIYIAQVDDYLKAREKQAYLDNAGSYLNLEFKQITPNKRHTWLTEGLQAEYDDFLPMGTKAAKAGEGQAIFELYSNGVKTNRDAWAYNFQADALAANIQTMINFYNEHVFRYKTITSKKPVINDFVINDDTKLSWSASLKSAIKRDIIITFDETKIVNCVYRPFIKQFLYFDHYLTERRYQYPLIFPAKESENRVICLTAVGNTKPFHALMTDTIVDIHLTGDTQCFPFYTYDEDGSNRQENITDWALAQFRKQYGDQLTKWDIFHYIYGLLHHPDYAATYQANLRRQLPRIPFVADLPAFVAVGQALAELHVNYESQPEYPLKQVEAEGEPLNWRVAKMRFSRDKTKLIYNEFLTLEGIPPAAFDYRLGIRSALEWVVDRYRVTTDKRSGIVNDPNDLHNPDYMVRLVGQVITVSLETVRLINSLPPLAILEA